MHLASSLEAEISDSEYDEHAHLTAPGTPAGNNRDGSEVRLVTEFRWSYDEENNEISPFCDIELHINGIPVTALVEHEKVGLNLSHWALQLLDWKSDFTMLAEHYPELVTYQDGWVWLKSSYITCLLYTSDAADE